MSLLNEKIFLKSLFKEAINAADPFTLLKNNVPDDPKGRTLIVGCGKAAASMAAAFETYWKGKSLSGLVVTMYGHKVPTKNVEVIEAGHPVPDLVGLNSAKRIYSLANDLRADDLMIFLVSVLTLNLR